MNTQKIIAFDFQGWPVEKMSFEDILLRMGAIYNPDTNKYEIEKTEKLNEYPIVLQDDGMAYGVNQQYITEVDFKDGTVWVDKEDKALPIYLEDEVQPGMCVTSPDGIEYRLYYYTDADGGGYSMVENVTENFKSRIITRDELKEWIRIEKEARKHES